MVALAPPRRPSGRADYRGSARRLRVPAARLRRAIRRLNRRTAHILRRRTLAAVPETLAALGVRLGITRQRVQQIERAGKLALMSLLGLGQAAQT